MRFCQWNVGQEIRKNTIPFLLYEVRNSLSFICFSDYGMLYLKNMEIWR